MITFSPNKALVFRLTHIDNLEYILNRQAIEARNHSPEKVSFRSIGNNEVIRKRSAKQVPVPPNGTLDDYVPFYFTPYSMMLYNIHTGYGENTQVANEDLVFFVGSLHTLKKNGIPFVFTDRHALMIHANYYSGTEHLGRVDWRLLASGDFSRDPNDPDKADRYQAEALVYKRVPLTSLEAIVCYNEKVEAKIVRMIEDVCDIRLLIRKEWYYK